MKPISNKRKVAAKKTLAASKKSGAQRRVLGLNSSKQVDAEWYYNLADVETVIAAVLAELDTDPGAGITLEAADGGITLNVTSTEGEEYTVDVELTAEGDEVTEEEVVEEEE